MIHELQVHLLYASIVWLAAWLLTSLPSITATVKYWIWVATTFNFILPLNLVPARLWPSPVSWFSPGIPLNGFTVTAPLIALWVAGAFLMLFRLSIRARRSSPRNASPSVAGLIRTRIRLPEGIDRVLDAGELCAVLAHETRHANRRDNLIRLLYELTLCALWFHPFVWLTGSRLALYRELSCDEAVADGSTLVSALAKLASPENELLLESGAASFIGPRIAHLRGFRRASPLATIAFAAIFAAVLVAAVVGPVAESGAAYLCALTHGLKP